jgi:hypothetical protein
MEMAVVERERSVMVLERESVVKKKKKEWKGLFESVTEKWLRKREMRNSKCEWNEVFVFCAVAGLDAKQAWNGRKGEC